MSLEQESYLLCWQAEMSARRLRSALGALRNVHDDFRPCQEVHDAVADYLRSAERAASERGRHYKWLTGGKKYTSPRATDGPPDVYEGPAEEAKATQFYPPSSVYCLTPTSEEAARKASMPWQPAALAEPATVDCPPGCQGCSVCGRRCDDCQEWGEECTCDVQDGYCLFCDSPCEGGECDPPHLCRKHGACQKCNP